MIAKELLDFFCGKRKKTVRKWSYMQLQLRSLTSTLVLLTLLIRGNVAFAATPIQEPSKYATGTFTNFEYNEEGDDLLGMEVKIVPVAGERFQAAIQISEGEPGPLVVVDVSVKGDAVAFKVDGNGTPGWSFRGSVTPKMLSGLITYQSGRQEKIRLARRCSYWDRKLSHGG